MKSESASATTATRIAANFAPERFGKGLERAASVAMGVPQKRFGVMDRALLLVTASYAR